MPETCWVSKKKNKNSKWHLVGFLFFNSHNMHGPLNISNQIYSSLAFAGFSIHDPQQKSKIPRTTDCPSLNKNQCVSIFGVFHFFVATLWWQLLLWPPVSPKTIPHSSKTSSNCQEDFMLLSVEGPSVVFLFLRPRSEFSKSGTTNPRKVRDESRKTTRRSGRSNIGNWPKSSLTYIISRRINSLRY